MQYLFRMLEVSARFAEELRALLRTQTAAAFAVRWRDRRVDAVGWEALEDARTAGLQEVPVTQEVDGLLTRLHGFIDRLVRAETVEAARLATFHQPCVERMQHAAAAALVAQRYGTAGLAAVAADGSAPVPRRYFAFLALAEQHPRSHWVTFRQYLTPEAHHAFLGAAAEAARYYRGVGAAEALVELFAELAGDIHLRAFLSPRILRSLVQLRDPETIPFLRSIAIIGHTAADMERCEVTLALVAIRRMTGEVAPNSKFTQESKAVVGAHLDAAERQLERGLDRFHPVTVI